MKEYKMIAEAGEVLFNDAVNEKLYEGWELYGSPQVKQVIDKKDGSREEFFYQAMIKDSE